MCRKSFKDDLLQSVRNPEELKDDQEDHPGDDDVINLNDPGVNTQMDQQRAQLRELIDVVQNL